MKEPQSARIRKTADKGYSDPAHFPVHT